MLELCFRCRVVQLTCAALCSVDRRWYDDSTLCKYQCARISRPLLFYHVSLRRSMRARSSCLSFLHGCNQFAVHVGYMYSRQCLSCFVFCSSQLALDVCLTLGCTSSRHVLRMYISFSKHRRGILVPHPLACVSLVGPCRFVAEVYPCKLVACNIARCESDP